MQCSHLINYLILLITFKQYDNSYLSIPGFKIETLKQHLHLTQITSTQVTELALYGVTENCPVQFLSHSSVVSLVNLRVNIKTLLSWATLLANALIVHPLTVYRWNTWNIPTTQTVWGEPKLNHLLYVCYYNQGVAENECVSLFTECCCHCCKLPYK